MTIKTLHFFLTENTTHKKGKVWGERYNGCDRKRVGYSNIKGSLTK